MTYELDTRAVFVGGPIDGQVQILQGRPYAWFVAQAPGIPSALTADVGWPNIVNHMYRIKVVDGHPSITDDGLTRYEYVGDR